MKEIYLLRKQIQIIFLTIFFVCLIGHARASDNSDAHAIAKQNACLGCHAVQKKVVGPSFQDIAKRYANNPDATEMLKNKILKGGSGSWGVVPMPANARLNDKELSLLLAWILRGAPGN